MIQKRAAPLLSVRWVQYQLDFICTNTNINTGTAYRYQILSILSSILYSLVKNEDMIDIGHTKEVLINRRGIFSIFFFLESSFMELFNREDEAKQGKA